MTSFHVQFEKVGRGLLRGGKRRERVGCVGEERGDEERVSVLEN